MIDKEFNVIHNVIKRQKWSLLQKFEYRFQISLSIKSLIDIGKIDSRKMFSSIIQVCWFIYLFKMLISGLLIIKFLIYLLLNFDKEDCTCDCVH